MFFSNSCNNSSVSFECGTKDIEMKSADNSFDKYIPDLQRTGAKLCGSGICAQRLVSSTLDIAQKKRWKKSKDLPTDAWLTMLMMQQYFSRAEESKNRLLH